MKKHNLYILLLLAFSCFLSITGCEEDINTADLNEPPKVAISVRESALMGLNLGAKTKPALTGTAQADAGLQEVRVELLKGSETVVLEHVTAFDEVSRIIYVFDTLPEYTLDVTGVRVSAVDELGRQVSREMAIETYLDPVFEPKQGLPGTEVTVTGPQFDNVTKVMIGETEVNNLSVEADGSSLTFEVPEGAKPGAIVIQRQGTYAYTSSAQFTVLSDAPKTLATYNNVVVNAQGNRNDEGVVTAFSANGKKFTLAEGKADPEVAAQIDFIATDSGGDEGLDLFSPNHPSWLEGNYFKKDAAGDMIWPVLNETQMVHLEDVGVEFFENATIETIEALPLEGASTRISLGPDAAGQSVVPAVILFQTSEGEKGLLYWKAHDPNSSAGSKADIFTFDIKVIEQE